MLLLVSSFSLQDRPGGGLRILTPYGRRGRVHGERSFKPFPHAGEISFGTKGFLSEKVVAFASLLDPADWPIPTLRVDVGTAWLACTCHESIH